MTNELNWLRSKATISSVDALEVEGATWTATTYHFRGTVPFRMISALRKQAAELVNHDTQTERLKLGNGYRGGECQCEYGRVEYTPT